MNRDQTRVLVIDDEPSVRKVLRDILATFGFQTDAVADGPAGIEQFRQHGYDVVITDLLMPGMTGVEVAAKLRDLDPKVGLILLTGSSSPAVSAEAKRDRLGLLHKPVSPDQLVAAVDRARSILARPSQAPARAFPADLTLATLLGTVTTTHPFHPGDRRRGDLAVEAV